jgi:hypothetical protein
LDVEAFIKRHPQLFHMAEAGSWPRIRRDGLLSTSALLDAFGCTGAERFAIESCRRPELVAIIHPDTGETVIIRDNKVLRENHLAAALTDMTPQEWYENLNRRVFFWVSPERLGRLLSGRAYRNRAHDVITVDTRSLVERDLASITLAPINTGYSLQPNASPRGSDTFKAIVDYPLEEYIKWRGEQDAIVELAVDYKVQDIEEVAVIVQRRHRDHVQKVLWPVCTDAAS